MTREKDSAIAIVRGVTSSGFNVFSIALFKRKTKYKKTTII